MLVTRSHDHPALYATVDSDEPSRSVMCCSMKAAARLFALFAAALLPALAAAQAPYPARPVTLVVPYPPGGATDVVARVLAEKLTPSLGQPVIVENKSGAGGNLGARAAAQAKPDGYTLLIGAVTAHSISMTLAKDTKKLNGLKLYFDCGTEDDYGFDVGARQLDEMLTKLGYAHEAHLYPGNHGWDYAKQHTNESLLFHWKAFNGK